LKKDLRKQIKQDEVLTFVGQGFAFLDEHKDEARITVAVLAVVALLGVGLKYFQDSRTRDAQAAFTEALGLYETPVAGEGPPQGGPTFASADEKFRKSAAAFEGVARRFPTVPVGRRARYYAALSRVRLGEDDLARQELTTLAADKDAGPLTSALARVALADLLKRKGKLDEAIAAYRELAQDGALAVPRDYPQWNLATTLEDAGRMKEAAAAYKQLFELFPGSAFAPDARRMASYLSGESREG
jgi:hypothetical protein